MIIRYLDPWGRFPKPTQKWDFPKIMGTVFGGPFCLDPTV